MYWNLGIIVYVVKNQFIMYWLSQNKSCVSFFLLGYTIMGTYAHRMLRAPFPFPHWLVFYVSSLFCMVSTFGRYMPFPIAVCKISGAWMMFSAHSKEKVIFYCWLDTNTHHCCVLWSSKHYTSVLIVWDLQFCCPIACAWCIYSKLYCILLFHATGMYFYKCKFSLLTNVKYSIQ